MSISKGDMVSWNSSGGNARGKVIRIVSSGKVNVPDSSFEITGTEDDPAVLIQLYRDGKPTETKVGHKMSTLRKGLVVEKHGNHDQRTHGRWAKDDSEGEFANTEGLHPAHRWSKDDSEGEFVDTEWQDIAAMDEMDLRHPPKPESYYQQFYRVQPTTVAKWIREEERLVQQNRRKGMGEAMAQSTARADMETKYKTKLSDLAIAHPEQIPDLRP